MSPFGAPGYVPNAIGLEETTELTPSQTGTIVKWSLFLGIIVITGLYLLVGYVHAQKRIKKGLPPLGYHRVRTCIASRSHLARLY